MPQPSRKETTALEITKNEQHCSMYESFFLISHFVEKYEDMKNEKKCHFDRSDYEILSYCIPTPPPLSH